MKTFTTSTNQPCLETGDSWHGKVDLKHLECHSQRYCRTLHCKAGATRQSLLMERTLRCMSHTLTENWLTHYYSGRIICHHSNQNYIFCFKSSSTMPWDFNIFSAASAWDPFKKNSQTSSINSWDACDGSALVQDPLAEISDEAIGFLYFMCKRLEYVWIYLILKNKCSPTCSLTNNNSFFCLPWSGAAVQEAHGGLAQKMWDCDHYCFLNCSLSMAGPNI